MVLGELGKKINSALASLTQEPSIKPEILDAIIKDISLALLESDVNVKLVQGLRDNIKQSLSTLPKGADVRKAVQKNIFNELVRLVDPGVEAFKPKKGRSSVLMTIGLQGAGKTTTCTKLAYFYTKRGYKTGLVCTDTFRAGAFDQLKQNASKAKIPFYGSYSESDPVKLAAEGVARFKSERFEVIIVDTSGRHKQESALFDEMKMIADAVSPDNVIFVMDGTIGQAAEAQCKAFKATIPIGSIIITKMDGHAKGGGAISAVAATQSPIVFTGSGELIHDLDVFRPRSFISTMLGMGDISGLMETITSSMDTEAQVNLIEKMQAGVFTIRDMRAQFEMISNMGPLSKVMGMMPGMPQQLLSQLNDQDGESKMKRMMCIMGSMNSRELDSDGTRFEEQHSRLYRVARGSGTTVAEVEALLLQYQQFAEMIKKMGGSNGLLSSLAKGGAPPSINALQSQMANILPPGMMEQMGGMGGFQGMMKNMMEGLGGMGGMEEMMRRMMGGASGGSGLPSMAVPAATASRTSAASTRGSVALPASTGAVSAPKVKRKIMRARK